MATSHTTNAPPSKWWFRTTMCTPAGLLVAKITVPAGRANLAQSLGARIPLLARAEGRGSSCLRMLRKTTATTPRPCRLRRAARESTDTRDRQHRRGEQCGKQRACATRRRGVRKQDFQSGATAGTGTLKVRAKRSTECAARAALQFNTCPTCRPVCRRELPPGPRALSVSQM